MKSENKFNKLLGPRNEIIRKIFFIFLGNFLCSIAINIFFVPNGMLSTGVGGIAIMLNFILAIPIGMTVLLLNIPLLIFGHFKLDKKFIAYTTFSILVYSSILNLTVPLAQIFVVKDKMLAAIFGALFNGLGMGLMFKNDVCQGGFDILASILKKEYNMNIGTGLTIFNTTIITLSALIFGATRAMYTLVAMYLGYKILDTIQTGFVMMKTIIIVSDRSDEMAVRIMQDMGRGVTFLKGEGAYTKTDKKILYCNMKSREIVELKKIVDDVDPAAFFTITDAVEVLGSGFADFHTYSN